MVAAGYLSPMSAAATGTDLSDAPAPFHVRFGNGARAKVSLHAHPSAPERFVRVCVEQQDTKGVPEHTSFWAFRTGDVVARVDASDQTDPSTVDVTPGVGGGSEGPMPLSSAFPLGLRYIGRIAGDRGEGGDWMCDTANRIG